MNTDKSKLTGKIYSWIRDQLIPAVLGCALGIAIVTAMFRCST